MSRSSAPFSPVQSRRRAEWYAQRGGTAQAQHIQLQQMQGVGALAASNPATNPAVGDMAPLQPAASSAVAANAATSAAAVAATSQPAVDPAPACSAVQPAASSTVAVGAGSAEASAAAAAAFPGSATGTTAATGDSSVSGSGPSSSEHCPPGQQQVQATKKIALKGGFGIGKKRSKRKGGNIFGAAAAEVRLCHLAFVAQ